MSATVDNDFYDELGERWLDDPGHAIALLAAEAPVKVDYVRTVLGLTGRRSGRARRPPMAVRAAFDRCTLSRRQTGYGR